MDAPAGHRTISPAAAAGSLTYRHRPSTRLWHWLNVVTVLCSLMSGLMIFNAHPRLYWGAYGANFDRAWLEIQGTPERGWLRVGGLTVDTTGVLGHWRDPQGVVRLNAFPHWATIPSTYDLAGARMWHLFFAWVLGASLLLYGLWSAINRHLQRDLLPTRGELRPDHLWQDIKDHARLRFPTGEAARGYNVLQKLSYLGVLFILLPLLVLTGLTMSPGMNAAWPWLLDLFGGRQSARSIHFIATVLMLGFIFVHVGLVLVTGPWNQLRAMVTGRYHLPRPRKWEDAA